MSEIGTPPLMTTRPHQIRKIDLTVNLESIPSALEFTNPKSVDEKGEKRGVNSGWDGFLEVQDSNQSVILQQSRPHNSPLLMKMEQQPSQDR